MPNCSPSLASASMARRLRPALAIALLSAIGPGSAIGAEPVSFRNEVAAVLSNAGCNAGTCHGNANGKGGFKLSLRGDDPSFDFEVITRDLRGRRINPADPAASLLLLKPTMAVAHGGGRRFEPDGPHYQTLRRWISEGARADFESAPRLVDLDVQPRAQTVVEPVSEVQLTATATFSDGRTTEVTGLAVYETSDASVVVTEGGLVRAERPGEVTIAVRFLNRQVPVRLAFVPDQHVPPSGVAVQNEIDRIVFDRLRELRVASADISDDATFVRRVHLDLIGVVPTGDEARAFLDDPAPDKRSRLVDRLLERPEFAEFWTLKWGDLLRAEEKTLDRKGVENFTSWMRVALSRNMPLDQFCRELIAGQGSTYASPAANYYRALRDPFTRAEATAQVFLGVRLQCAKCHNHPFDQWTQDDYYGWSSVFAGIDYKILENRRRDSNDNHEFNGEQIVYATDQADVEDPRGGTAPAKWLGDVEVPPGSDRLSALAEWATSPDNPYFARTQVNRVWSHLLGRGIVDPVDDFRVTNPPLHPGLLEWLTEDFVLHGFDLRHLIRTITDSSVYQLASEPNSFNAGHDRHFARGIVRRLSAEQLLDSLACVTGSDLRFTGYPEDLRAGQLPGVRAIRLRDESPSPADQFLTKFGKPPRLQSCDCERSDAATLSQAFDLASGPLVNQLLTDRGNRLADLLKAESSDEQLVTDIFWNALSRPPTPEELTACAQHLNSSGNRRQGAEDVLWSLVTSTEFLFRR